MIAIHFYYDINSFKATQLFSIGHLFQSDRIYSLKKERNCLTWNFLIATRLPVSLALHL